MTGKAPTAVRRVATAGAAALLTVASIWDVTGALGWLSGSWPIISHSLVAAGIAAASVAILVRTLQRKRGASHDSRATAVELLGVGVFLGAWLLRGHAEIPPDPPLIGAQLVALLLLASAAWRRRRSAGTPRH